MSFEQFRCGIVEKTKENSKEIMQMEEKKRVKKEVKRNEKRKQGNEKKKGVTKKSCKQKRIDFMHLSLTSSTKKDELQPKKQKKDKKKK